MSNKPRDTVTLPLSIGIMICLAVWLVYGQRNAIVIATIWTGALIAWNIFKEKL